MKKNLRGSFFKTFQLLKASILMITTQNGMLTIPHVFRQF